MTWPNTHKSDTSHTELKGHFMDSMIHTTLQSQLYVMSNFVCKQSVLYIKKKLQSLKDMYSKDLISGNQLYDHYINTKMNYFFTSVKVHVEPTQINNYIHHD